MSKKELPQPAGYRLLLKPRDVSNTTRGGIILTDELVEHAKFSCVVSQIVSMGPDCYKDHTKAQTEWAKVGDWVLTGKYVGLKFVYEKETYSVINDDEVIAIVPDPSKISAK
jgi:chaperonin GroES|tara:strand:+ start:126 stop:461 length:336 start_codon:yes stop_codon:yes gene_type:complete